MQGLLYIPYSNGDPEEGFRYDRPELTKEQYAKLLVDTYKKYKTGVWEMFASQRLGTNIAVNEYDKEYAKYRQQDYYYANTPVNIRRIDNQEMTIDELIHYFQTGEPFILIVNTPFLGREEYADIATDVKGWCRECKRITESGKFTAEEQIAYLSKKTMKVKFDQSKSSAILRNCKMVQVVNNRTFAFLVEEIIFITEDTVGDVQHNE